MSVDVSREIRRAVETGKVGLGSQKTVKMAMVGGPKAVVLARNCPAATKADVERYCSLSKIPVIGFNGTSIELGTVCGKPFPVSALCVLEEGNSKILEAVA